MSAGRVIKVKARVIVVHDDKVLLEQRLGPSGTYVRPLGGNVEFGESGAAAVEREFAEETGLHLRDIHYLGCAEDIGSTDRGDWHEIWLLYAADIDELEESGVRQAASIRVQEDDQRVFSAHWIPFDQLSGGTKAPGEVRPADLYDWIRLALGLEG